MTKVALGPHTWIAAYVREPKHVRVSKHKKCKFFAIMAEVWNESHIVLEPFQTPFFHYIKPYMVHFQKHTENPKGKPMIR